jgi:hypothetical protein
LIAGMLDLEGEGVLQRKDGELRFLDVSNIAAHSTRRHEDHEVPRSKA